MVLKSLSPNIINDEISNIIEMIPLIKKYNNINQNKYMLPIILRLQEYHSVLR